MYNNLKYTILLIEGIPFVIFSILIAMVKRFTHHKIQKKRIVFGSTPLINNVYWARALRKSGYEAETFTTSYYKRINERGVWDLILTEKYTFLPMHTRCYFAFMEALIRYDIYVIPVSGFFIGHTPYASLQSMIFKLARKKIIVIPYGADAYVYSRVKSENLKFALQKSYPEFARQQRKISQRLEYWTQNADVMVPAFMSADGFGRSDIIIPSVLFLDLSEWNDVKTPSEADGTTGTVYVAHAPNHRGFKGTEFIIDSISQLQQEGLKVELLLLENVQNNEVKRILQNNADILVEQLIFTGHGLNGLEGLACGLPVISNLAATDILALFRRYSFFSDCPIVSATPDTITDCLRTLIRHPKLRASLGNAGRCYVETHHDLDAAEYFFKYIIECLIEDENIEIDLFNPRKNNNKSKDISISHILVDNEIVNHD